jgi:hypothetical protein
MSKTFTLADVENRSDLYKLKKRRLSRREMMSKAMDMQHKDYGIEYDKLTGRFKKDVK